MSSNESYPQHVVTAVIVAHDGATWLPHVADAVLDQSRPVQRVVAVDTGSRDRSGAVLASKFGQQAVFGMDRSTGYGAAVARALAHRAANVPVPGAPGGPAGERVEWIWLLHDDCEPAADALEQLLRGVAETSSAAVLGPKLKDWANRDVILEAGITLDTAARRVTGIEPREVDQGQHDGDRDALAVSSAGMLVRREVWDQVGGFDEGMSLFGEDIDFCWRVHAAGYRVRVITDAVAFHAMASTKRRRAVSVGRRARMLDRRNGLLTLLGNLPLRQLPSCITGNIAVSLLRITFFLLAKRLTAAMDEAAALVAVLGHPLRLFTMRRRRARGRKTAYTRVKADLPAGHSVRRLAEFAASALSKSQADTAGSHHASADPTDDDSLLEDNGLARRLLTSPTLLTFLGLLVVSLVACRSLLQPGPLGGGSLLPAWGGASDLWRTYVQSFHPAGIGSTSPAPPWLAVIAGLATVLAGKPWLAIDVILLGCVPLAGMTAMLAVRRVTKSAPVRVWACATYALLPVATGVIASGRFGSAVAFVLLPLIVLLAGRIFTSSRQQANRAGWATGLLVAVAAAFVPLLWLVAAAACVIAAAVFRNTRAGVLRNLAIVVLTAPVLLLPWTITLIQHPAGVLLEAGLPQPGTPVAGLPARALMLLSPGGPGLPAYWVTGGLVVAALAALFAGRRRKLITAGWGLALSGLLTAIVVSHLTVRPDDGGPVVVWAGLPLAVAALGFLLAAAVGADALGRMLGGRGGLRAILSARGLVAALLAAIACATPVLAAVAWIGSGVSGPVHPVASPVVPELVAAADGQANQVRTLVIRQSNGHLWYLLLRGPSPSLADAALTPPAAAQQALSKVVAALITPGGSTAVNPAQQLAGFDIGYVLVEAPVAAQLAEVLNSLVGVRLYSTTHGYSLWQLATPPARVTVLERDGTVVPIPSGPTGVEGAAVPASGGTLMLAEPAGGWTATVNGQALAQVPSPAGPWAQAFRLPGGGGTLTIGHPGLGHDLVLLFELLAFLVVAGLALPGIHVTEAEGQRQATAAGADQDADTGRPKGRGRQAGARAADGSEADDKAAAAGGRLAGAAGRAGVAAAASRIGTSRSARGARSRSRKAGKAGKPGGAAKPPGRGRTAASGQAGQREAGRPGQDPAGLDLDTDRPSWPYDRADAGRGAGNDDASRTSGSHAAPGASAWPYDSADGAVPPARRSEESYRPGEDLAADSRRARGDRGEAGARRSPSERDAAASAGSDFGITGPAPWAFDDRRDEPHEERRSAPAAQAGRQAPVSPPGGVRSPSGRPPSGAWPYPDDDAGQAAGYDSALPARSPSGRTPSQSWPQAQVADPRGGSGSADVAGRGGRRGRHGRRDASQDFGAGAQSGRDYRSDGDYEAGDYAGRGYAGSRDSGSRDGGRWSERDYDTGGHARGDYGTAGQAARGFDADRRATGEHGGGDYRDGGAGRDYADRDYGAGGYDDGYPASGGRPGSTSGGRQAAGGGRYATGRDSGYGDQDYEDRDYGDRSARDRDYGGAARGGRDQGSGRDWDEPARGYGRRGRDSGADDEDAPRRSRWPGTRSGSGDQDGRGGQDRPARAEHPSRLERLGVGDRWGRRGKDEDAESGYGGGASGRRDGGLGSGWPGGGGDALEPLPPPGGQNPAAGRRNAWRPADDEDDWGQAGGQRWSAPVPEPDYEGDSW